MRGRPSACIVTTTTFASSEALRTYRLRPLEPPRTGAQLVSTPTVYAYSVGTFLVAAVAIVLLALWAGVLIVRAFFGLLALAWRLARL